MLTAEETEEPELDGECCVMHLGSLITDKSRQPHTIKLQGFVKGVLFSYSSIVAPIILSFLRG